MDYITKVKQKAKSQQKESTQIVANLLIKKEGEIFSKTKKRWLLGKSVFGGEIGQYRNSSYRAFKLSINSLASGSVDLTLTGALGKGLNLEKKTETQFRLFSTDSKYNSIGSKYGYEEFGITEIEWMQLQQDIYILALEELIKKTYE